MNPAAPFALVVEDHHEVAESLRRVLEKMGVVAVVAQDGEAALKVMNTQHFDLIVVDILLPRVNGLEVMRAIRLLSHLREVPVIVISCVTDAEAQAQAAAMGAVHYLCKPFEMFEFQAQVERILKPQLMRRPFVASTPPSPDGPAYLPWQPRR